jgi:hypothetical protein
MVARGSTSDHFFNYQYMKALIKICKAGKFTQSDRDAFRRILLVLDAHQLSAKLTVKEKKTLTIKNLIA